MDGPEIVIGLVGAVGTPMHEVAGDLEQQLRSVGYSSNTVVLSELLDCLEGLPELDALDSTDELSRLQTKMEAGSRLREELGRGDVLAGLGMALIGALREQATGGRAPDRNKAYIIRSLKHPSEVESLRRVYGQHFVLLGLWTARDARIEKLSSLIADTQGHMQSAKSRVVAEERIAIDEQEQGRRLGQNVQDTFPQADFFIDVSTAQRRENGIDRFVRLFFGDPFVTPTKDESAMFHAYAAALRSAALGRQVGAAIVDDVHGDVLCVGMNEVPKAHGGHYWDGDEPDGRDFRLGRDTSDAHKQKLVHQVLKSMLDAGWLHHPNGIEDLGELVAKSLAPGGPLKQTWLMSLTEFGRDVHAEMSALISAARRGVSVQGATLYCTTFPCHNCTKHIVAAGIRKVVYIEPYAKSFARDFHLDAISVDGSRDEPTSKIPFMPFTGTAPSQYVAWFTMGDRKTPPSGDVVRWQRAQAVPRFVFTDPGYIEREAKHVDKLWELLHARKISVRD